MTFSIKKLFIAMIAGLVLAVGFVLPASAAPVTSPSVSSTGLVAGQTNPNPIVISMTTPTGSQGVNISIPSDWTWAQTSGPVSTPCVAPVQVTGFTQTFCRFGVSPFTLDLYTSNNTTPIAAGTTVTVTIAAGGLNVGSATDFILSFQNGPTVIDTSTVSIAPSSPAVVTFDANGGSGSMSTQSSSSAITLTPNAFTRTNYNFAGWNTAADGSGTAYADAASFPFTSSATLYAQWTPTLANTGMSDVTWQMGEITLALMGFGILLYIRQRKRNA